MNNFGWQVGGILILVTAIFLPWLALEIRAALRRQRKRNRYVDPCQVARRHRAIVRNGFKSRMGVR